MLHFLHGLRAVGCLCCTLLGCARDMTVAIAMEGGDLDFIYVG